MLTRVIDKTPWLVLERAAVLIALDKKQIAFAGAEVASVTKVDAQFKEYEKKQADKRKLADEEAELLLAGLGQEEADREAEDAAAEEAWRDVCVQHLSLMKRNLLSKIPVLEHLRKKRRKQT